MVPLLALFAAVGAALSEQEALDRIAEIITKTRGSTCTAPTIPSGSGLANGSGSCTGDSMYVKSVNGKLSGLFVSQSETVDMSFASCTRTN